MQSSSVNRTLALGHIKLIIGLSRPSVPIFMADVILRRYRVTANSISVTEMVFVNVEIFVFSVLQLLPCHKVETYENKYKNNTCKLSPVALQVMEKENLISCS